VQNEPQTTTARPDQQAQDWITQIFGCRAGFSRVHLGVRPLDVDRRHDVDSTVFGSYALQWAYSRPEPPPELGPILYRHGEISKVKYASRSSERGVNWRHPEGCVGRPWMNAPPCI
jgi:hypothetical protein